MNEAIVANLSGRDYSGSIIEIEHHYSVQREGKRAMTDRSASAGSRQKRRKRGANELIASILAAARAEFDIRGPHGATTAAIAARAGVSEAQLFRYFPRKATLFREAMLGALNAHLADLCAARLPFAAGDRNAVDRHVGTLLGFLRKNRQLLVALLSSQTFAGGEENGPIAALTDYFETEAAMRAGRPDDSDHRMGVRMSFAAALGAVVFRDWLFPPGLASDDAIENAFADFILIGLGKAR